MEPTPTAAKSANPVDMRYQVVSGVLPPEMGEALIRQAFPSVAAIPAAATLGRQLMLSKVGAPLAWLMLAPLYFKKILPFLATRYRLTNRRVMICRGLKPQPVQEVRLADIDDVRVVHDANSAFYRAGNLEIVSGGRVALTLPGVPEADSFRIAILNACKAWVPGKKLPGFEFVPATS
jgi:hypothetical protein